MNFFPVIGLEVHAQLLTETKVFCGCSTAFGDPPNTNTCPVCLGHPGVLPVLNHKAVLFALKLALALDCRINPVSSFARKNYFYPDLPKGYQITQYEHPMAEDGKLRIDVGGRGRDIRIRQIHLEEDAGKSMHEGFPDSHESSYLDFNRAGIPLVEIVTYPEMKSPEEAHACLVQFRSVLQYLGICNGNMEEGSLRCDANLSVQKEREPGLNPKTEIKNLNSFRNVQKGLAYEFDRQVRIISDGETIVQETRLWDAAQSKTVPMRQKEEIQDYRYFPEPDLPELVIEEAWIDKIKSELLELPSERKARFMKQYGLPEYDADFLVSSRDLADYFEATCRVAPYPKTVSNWIMGPLVRELNRDGTAPSACRIPPEKLGNLVKAIQKGIISGKMAKSIFEEMYTTGEGSDKIIKNRGLLQVSDEEELLRVIGSVLESHPGPLEQYRSGKKQTFAFFMGQVMKATEGRANPHIALKLLKKILEEDSSH